jgi:general secretion pathway protein N
MIGGGWWKRHRWTSSETLATTVMAAICCVLAALIYVELDEQPVRPLGMSPPGASGTSPGSTGSAPSQPEFALRPYEAYSAVLARPVFSPTRRPPPPAEAAVAGSDDFVLSGIVSTAADRTALIRTGQPLKTVRLKEGQTIVGWTVRSISADGVLIENGEITRELKLREKSQRGSTGG